MTQAPRLPFSFARRHGVLLEAGQLLCRSDTLLSVLAEVRRRHGAPPRSQVLGAEAFALRLAEHYRDGQDDAMQMAEGLGDQIADPFDTQPNDLALDAMCRNLEIAVRELAGETAPAPLQPVKGVLL